VCVCVCVCVRACVHACVCVFLCVCSDVVKTNKCSKISLQWSWDYWETRVWNKTVVSFAKFPSSAMMHIGSAVVSWHCPRPYGRMEKWTWCNQWQAVHSYQSHGAIRTATFMCWSITNNSGNGICWIVHIFGRPLLHFMWWFGGENMNNFVERSSN